MKIQKNSIKNSDKIDEQDKFTESGIIPINENELK